MTIAATLALSLAGCSKDSSPAKDVAKEYAEAELVATNGGVEINGGSLKIAAIDNTTAELELTNIINGHSKFTMNAQVIQTKAEYSFTGTKDTDGMKVSVSGTVINGKATVNADVEITSTEILNTWTYNTIGSDDNKSLDAFDFDLKNKSGQVHMTSMDGKNIPVAEFNEVVKTWVQMILGMAFPNLQLSFAKDGYVGVKGTSNFSPEGQQNIDIPKLARYYYNPTTKVLIFDAPLDALLKSEDSSPVGVTIQVPFICKLENGTLIATIDPNFITPFFVLIPQGDDLKALLDQLDTIVPPGLGAFLPTIKNLITDVIVAITDKDMTSLTISAKLAPYVNPAN